MEKSGGSVLVGLEVGLFTGWFETVEPMNSNQTGPLKMFARFRSVSGSNPYVQKRVEFYTG